MNDRKSIHFYGAFSLCSETNDILYDCPHASDEGIYLWTVQMVSGNYRISYIGETGVSFYKRTKEHLIQTLGGNYQICDPEAMKGGLHKVIWNGLWRKGTRDRFAEFLSKYETLAPTIKQFVTNHKVFVAPIKIERRLRQRIEGALANAIKNDDTASSLFPKDIRYYQRKDSEEPILISFSADKIIEGLPKLLKV